MAWTFGFRLKPVFVYDPAAPIAEYKVDSKVLIISLDMFLNITNSKCVSGVDPSKFFSSETQNFSDFCY